MNPSQEALIDRILTSTTAPPPPAREPDYEAMWERRRDPEQELERAEDDYERHLGVSL